MDSESFRLVQKRHDIAAILNEPNADLGGDLWQVDKDSQRTIYSLVHVSIDFLSEKIIFEAKEKILFNPLQPVFVRINHKSLAFKLLPGEYKLANERIIGKFPRDGRALEFRTQPRFLIPPKVYLQITLRPAIGHTLARIEGTIVDISTRGIGIALNERYKQLVFRESVLVVLKIAGMELNGSLQCKVMNIPGRVWGIKNGEFKVGIKFSETITSEIYQHVITSSKTLLSKD